MDNSDQNIANSGEQGAAAGSVAGPWGAVAGGAAGVLSGLIGSGQGEKEIDMAALLQTINSSGQYQQQLINSLPAEIQANLRQYAASQGQALGTLQGQVGAQGAAYTKGLTSIYGPNSDAANAQKSANTQAAYSSVPGTQDAIRNALAATGGLSRGNAGASLAQPYVQAAQNAGQANANVNAQQTQLAQGASAKALDVVNSMDANLFQTQFGMSQQQAQQILSTGNTTLQNQLAQLIMQNQNQTNQTLGVQGIQAQNGYQNALQQQGYQNAIYNGLGNTAINLGTNYMNSAGSTSSGLPASADVSSPNYQMNMYQNAPAGSY